VSVFVDTSAFYATVDAGDIGHERALEVLDGAGSLVTTDHVLVETWQLINARGGRFVAEQFWSRVRGGLARVEIVITADMDLAWQIGQDFPDQRFSIVDRTSFAAMQRLGINAVATFDDHFAIYRYGRNRDRAFEVRR
jgi:predicted nucleic acid-binding protein